MGQGWATGEAGAAGKVLACVNLDILLHCKSHPVRPEAFQAARGNSGLIRLMASDAALSVASAL